MPDVSRAGSSVVLFVLIALTPVCQFDPLAASLSLLFALVGNIKVVIFAGENSALYSGIFSVTLPEWGGHVPPCPPPRYATGSDK